MVAAPGADAARGACRERDEPEADAAFATLQSIFLERDAAALDRFVRMEKTPRWKQAAMIGNWSIYASPDEVEELTKQIVELVDHLRRTASEAPPGAARVHVSFRALPQDP